MIKDRLKNIFQGSTILLCILILVMLVAKTEINFADNSKKMNSAAISGSNSLKEAQKQRLNQRLLDIEYQMNEIWKDYSKDPTKHPDKGKKWFELSDKRSSVLQQLGAPENSELPWGEQIHHEGEPWGGLVTFKYDCDCPQEIPGSYFVILNDYVRNKQILLKYEEFKSKAYMFWVLKVGGYGLGTMDVGGRCYTTFYDPECRRPLEVDGVINSGPGFGSSGQTGLSFPSILDSGSPLDFMNGGTVPATFTF